MKKLFEEYVESPDYKIGAFFKELAGDIKKWFSPEGTFGSQKCKIIGGDDDGESSTSSNIDGGITISNTNPMEKFLMFKFTEPEFQDKKTGNVEQFYYRVNFIVRIDQMTSEAAQDDLLGDMNLGQTGDAAGGMGGGDMDMGGGDMGGDESAPPAEAQKNLNVGKVLLKIQKYNSNDVIVKELVEEINIKDIKEDYISNKISQLEDNDKKTDLEDNITEA